VYHIGGASLPQGNPRKAYYNFRNSLLMLYKNLPPAEWRRVMGQRVALDAAAAARAFLQGNRDEARAILRAYRDAFATLDAFASVRPSTSSVRPPYRGCIAVDYFLRGRTTFGELPEARFTPMTNPGRSRPN